MLPKLSLADVQVEAAEPIIANATIGEVKTHTTPTGYVHVAFPLLYNSEDPDSDTAPSVPSTFTARMNIRPEWFDSDYVRNLKEDNPDEYIQYKINFAGTVRGLFKALSMAEIDFEAIEGKRVRFKAAGSKKEPDRLQIKNFYPEK